MKYIASVSFGKDSLAMLLYLIENKLPLDEVVFYDTGMEFECIYKIRDSVKELLLANNIKYTELQPKNPFIYDMLERPVEGRKNGFHYGYGWCGGPCRWGTTNKIKALDSYIGLGNVQYVGIAKDEYIRAIKLPKNKIPLLYDIGMTEADCLRYCRERGYSWTEKANTDSGYIDLYDVLSRVSCWCCANKNKKELYNIYKYLPEYWCRLRDLQGKIKRPFKKYYSKTLGYYGDIYSLEKVFEKQKI